MAVALLSATAAPALAHGDTGEMTLEVTTGDDPRRARVGARITYTNDGEAAVAAAVTVEAVAPDGTVGATAPLAVEGDGRYAGELALPASGPWTIRVTATNPTAAAETVFQAAEPATTTRPPATDPPATIADRGTGGERSGADSDDDGISTFGVTVGLVGLLGVVFTMPVIVLIRRRIGNTSPD